MIVGDGPLRSDLNNLTSQLGLSEFVHFVGTQNNIWEILPHLDLFVLPSYWEGFPTVLIEAMSQDVPVIATDIPGNRELVENGITGQLVPPGKPEILAEAIIAKLNDPAGSLVMTQRARELASQFTVQNTSECYADFYQRLIH